MLLRTEDAAATENRKRFNAGLKITDPVPFTAGLRAHSLAALLPNLQQLSIDERTSCLGGMTNEFATAVAYNCPGLKKLEVGHNMDALMKVAGQHYHPFVIKRMRMLGLLSGDTPYMHCVPC